MTQPEFWRWKEYTWKSENGLAPDAVLTGGIDVGSVSSQAVVLADRQLYAFANLRTGADSSESSVRAMNAALDGTGLKLADIRYVVGSGYGRVNVPFAHKTITEITCHARGVNYLNPAVRTILDMGGQDFKANRCDAQGKVTQFLMNDKCAAGTGRSIEVIAQLIGIPITEVGPLSMTVETDPAPISSTCVIFAKSEVIDLLRRGWSKPEVLAAYFGALARRVSALIQRLGVAKEFAISGGIAKNIGVVTRIERELGVKAVSLGGTDPQIAGAIGAALLAHGLFAQSRSR
ncbi:MAG: benzoyl-CoA reductase, bzd-type, subunit Q [Chloroflexi bacterium]|nr:benzoyl-CoA reductase, bzd-type, subunit Q [Chloroflexota bacterium]